MNGWTPNFSTCATRPQIEELITMLGGFKWCKERDNAIAAARNFLNCMDVLLEAIQIREAEEDAKEYLEDAQERADLYESGMGR